MIQEKQDFHALFDSLSRQNKPFVFFRLPQAKEVVLYQQDTHAHFQTTDLTEEGFVFAPFQHTGTYTYIPNTHQKKLPIPKASSKTTSNKNTSEQQKNNYLKLVETAKKQIQDTSLQKVVVSRKHTTKLTGTLGEAFSRLIAAYPDAMVYYWSHPQTGNWMGATPETLLHLQQNTVHTMALAGTLPFVAGNKPNWTSKELEEQSMVVHYIEERLSQALPKENITIADTYTKRAGNIVHLCTDISVPTNKCTTKELVELLHPTPAVAGLPMANSIQFIIDNEAHDRSFYAGFLGPVSKESTNLYVNLRCAAVFSEQLTLYVGGGITANSNAEDEWQESQRKAETLLRVL